MVIRKTWILLVCLCLVSGCAIIRPPTPGSTPTISRASSPQVTQSPTGVHSVTPIPSTTTPDSLTNGTQTQAAWTATFAAFTQAAVASQTHAVQTATINAATFSAGYALTETAVLNMLKTTVTPQVFQSLRSPDGQWLAQIIRHDCTRLRTEPGYWPDAYEILRIGDQEVANQHYFCGGLGAYGFDGKFWTSDSRFFYYTNTREGWPDGGYPWRHPISRYDTINRTSETLHLAIFSPDQSKIAGSQDMDLVIWEVNSNNILRFSGLPADHAPFRVIWSAWSPDGRSLAYLTQTLCTDTYPCPTTLNLVDTLTLEQTELLDLSDLPMLTVEWVESDTLSLWGADFQSTWLFDLKQNTLSLVPPTTTPTPPPNRTPKP